MNSSQNRNAAVRATTRSSRARQFAGFTLVEMLVVITIIGVLAALLIPAIAAVRRTVNGAAMKMEAEGLSQAIESYNQKYGDYPPDFSDFALVTRHYRKIFPNIQSSELELLRRATTPDPVSGGPRTFGILMDRGEALVWALGGFSSDAERPFSGSGGPLVAVPETPGGPPLVPTSYNTDRDNQLFAFKTAQLGLVQAGTVVTAGADGDFLPDFRYEADMDPFVYFDARTYFAFVDTDGDDNFDDHNGYNGGVNPFDDVQGVRPYVSNEPSSSGTPKFVNAQTFQLLGPGIDGSYGTNFRTPLSSSSRTALYFQYPTGSMITVTTDFSAPTTTIAFVNGSNGYLESSYNPLGLTLPPAENQQLDNIANFCTGTLGDDFEE